MDLALCTTPSRSEVGRSGWHFRTVRGGTNPDDIVCPRIVGFVGVWMDSDPGMGPYRPRVTLSLYTSMAKERSDTNAMFLFSSELEPEILICQNLKRCHVLYLQEVNDLQQQAGAL